ncbi:heme-binding protein [Litorivivens sp.]|uniref:GlcG/HbpS family heme-binding protein n=1 Tax=Litorivivens sp. TaxID=2020868 RepID=UPI00356A5E78
MSGLTFTSESISSAAALTLIDRAVAKASEMDLAVAIAVVDTDGMLKAFHRMDGTPVIAVDAVPAKARAALMGLSTEELAEALSDNQANLLSMVTMKDVTLLGGGLPIRSADRIIGAIGVGGALTEEDVAIAEAALAALSAFD